jgi:hypothetical protein
MRDSPWRLVIGENRNKDPAADLDELNIIVLCGGVILVHINPSFKERLQKIRYQTAYEGSLLIPSPVVKKA